MRKVSPEKERAILRAADELLASGIEDPTNDQVREHLGGGSIADISPVMRRWREDRKKLAGVTLTMPETVAAAGQMFLANLWAAAENESTKAVEAVQSECQEKVAAVEAERDEALDEIQRVEGESAELRTSMEALQHEIAALTEQVASLSEESHALSLEREKALARADAAQESQAQLMDQLKDAQANNKALQGELVKLAKAAKAPAKKK